jgi:type 1 fimbria pilin
MRNWKKSCQAGLLMALALILTLPLPLLAQARGQFSGTVVDQTGAVVVGATVTATNERTGEVRTAMTDAAGRYVIAGLAASVYTLKATFGQFAPLEYTGMTLVAAQDFAIDLALQPAGVTETVTVVAQTNTVDLSSARQGVNVGEKELQALPVNGRQMSRRGVSVGGAVGTDQPSGNRDARG